MKDWDILASCLLSPISKLTNREPTNHFKLKKDPDSNRVKKLLINKTKSVTLYDNLLTIRDTDRKFELEGDISKKITNKNYNVDVASLPDERLMS